MVPRFVISPEFVMVPELIRSLLMLMLPLTRLPPPRKALLIVPEFVNVPGKLRTRLPVLMMVPPKLLFILWDVSMRPSLLMVPEFVIIPVTEPEGWSRILPTSVMLMVPEFVMLPPELSRSPESAMVPELMMLPWFVRMPPWSIVMVRELLTATPFGMITSNPIGITTSSDGPGTVPCFQMVGSFQFPSVIG